MSNADTPGDRADQWFDPASGLTIELATGSADEKQVREWLLELLAQYELTPWRFTSRIRIERGAMSHSHPVLTLGTGYPGKTALLSNYLHEQLHWFSASQTPTDEFRREMRTRYPNPPVGPPDGAQTELSAYIHYHVCFLEFCALRELLGEERARLFVPQIPYYRAIYSTVLRDTDALEELFRRHGGLPASPK